MTKDQSKSQDDDIETGGEPSHFEDIMSEKDTNYDPVFGEGQENGPNYRSVSVQGHPPSLSRY